jgi:transposase
MNLESKIAELERKIAEMSFAFANQTAMLVSQIELNKKQAAIISTQQTAITAQTLEIANLKRQLAEKQVRATSKNSHLPPSKDLTRSSKKTEDEVKRNQSLREKSDKPIGGQKGHEGYNLKMSETPEVVEDLIPDYCNECGLSLKQEEEVFVGRRQVIDIPPITPITTEYRQYKKTCSCGHCQHSTYPQEAQHPIQYGPNIQSYVVYQNIYQYVPFFRLQDFFKKVMNVSISKGTIENIIRRSAKKASGVYENLRQAIEISFFVGSDETGGRVNGKKNWFWVWQTAVITYIIAACSRSKQVIEDTFPDGLPNSIVCSDRLAAQLSTISKGSQICLVHLLRDLNYLIEKEKTEWATQFKQLLKDALQLKREQSQYNKEDEKVKLIEQRADNLLKATFEELEWTKDKQHKTMTFYKGMIKLRHALFPFLYHSEVMPDNNGSERAIRPIKVKLKISGQFKSLQNEFAILRSVIDTAIKNGQQPFEAIKAIIYINL